MRDVVIVGSGDQARVAHFYLSEDSPYRVAAFAVHAAHINGRELLDLPLLRLEEIAQTHPPTDYDLFVAIGFQEATDLRAAIYDECRDLGYEFVNYVSSCASCCRDLQFGNSCFIGDLVCIQPFTKLGNNVMISSGTVIGHDVAIGDHVFIGPGVVILGRVTIGKRCFIGGNATLRNGVNIADHCIIGAGALILNDTRPEQVLIPKGTKRLPIKTGAFSKAMRSRKSSQN